MQVFHEVICFKLLVATVLRFRPILLSGHKGSAGGSDCLPALQRHMMAQWVLWRAACMAMKCVMTWVICTTLLSSFSACRQQWSYSVSRNISEATLFTMQVHRAAVKATVEALKDCLLGSGMSCPLAQSLISAVSPGEPAHYISTLYQLGQDSQVFISLLPVSSIYSAATSSCIAQRLART